MVEPAGPIKTFFKSFQKYTFVYMCIIITYFISGMLINLVQAVMYWTLRYANIRLYRKINYYFIYSSNSVLLFVLEWWADTEVILYVDKEEFKAKYGKEHGLVIMNHSFEIDWVVAGKLCEHLGIFGNGKSLTRKEYKNFPALGLSVRFGEWIFLERSYEKDKKVIHDGVQNLCDYPDPIWLLLYPEGTLLKPARMEASLKFAKERGLPILKHHLLPRTKGFVTCMKAMRDKIEVVYAIQLAFHKEAESPPSIMSLLTGKVLQAHLYIRRIPVEEIPHDEEGITQWLIDHYEMKDRMQDSFYNTGSFFKESGVKPLPPFVLPRSIYPLINTIFWGTVILIPLFSYLWIWLITGQYLYFIVTSCFLLMLNLLFKLGERAIKVLPYGKKNK